MLIFLFQDGRGPHKVTERNHQHTAERRYFFLIVIIIVIDVLIICDRHVQALLPDGQRAEAPDPRGGRRLPLRRLLRHRPHHLRLRLTHSRPQPRAGGIIMVVIMLATAFKQITTERTQTS